MRICGTLQSPTHQYAQVDAVGNAWVAGYTDGSLDGNSNMGGYDVFLMKLDSQGVHLWTRQRGGESHDCAYALQADWVRLRFRIFFMEEKHGTTLEPLARSMFRVTWSVITIQINQLVGCLYNVDILYILYLGKYLVEV